MEAMSDGLLGDLVKCFFFHEISQKKMPTGDFLQIRRIKNDN